MGPDRGVGLPPTPREVLGPPLPDLVRVRRPMSSGSGSNEVGSLEWSDQSSRDLHLRRIHVYDSPGGQKPAGHRSRVSRGSFLPPRCRSAHLLLPGLYSPFRRPSPSPRFRPSHHEYRLRLQSLHRPASPPSLLGNG